MFTGKKAVTACCCGMEHDAGNRQAQDLEEIMIRGCQIVIDVSPEGDVRVDGPLDQKAFCYGVLEMAKDAVRRFGEDRRIVKPDEDGFNA